LRIHCIYRSSVSNGVGTRGEGGGEEIDRYGSKWKTTFIIFGEDARSQSDLILLAGLVRPRRTIDLQRRPASKSDSSNQILN
jgi:hypothetical protein